MTYKKKISLPLYSGYLIIISTTKFEKICRKYGLENINNKDDYNYTALTFWNQDKHGRNRYYYLQRKKISNGSIAHEAKHIVNRIFMNIGYEIDMNNDEAECYLIGWIVNRIHDFNKKLK